MIDHKTTQAVRHSIVRACTHSYQLVRSERQAYCLTTERRDSFSVCRLGPRAHGRAHPRPSLDVDQFQIKAELLAAPADLGQRDITVEMVCGRQTIWGVALIMKPTEPPVLVQSVTGERTELELLPFPASIELAGQELVLRHMQADDGAAILRFAKALPQRDLLFLRRDITDRADVEAWVADALAGQTPTILTFVGPQLIGYVLLAAERVPWARHVAEVRALIAPEWRRSGLGGLLVSQAVALARREGHVKLIAQMTYDQGGAFGAFTRLGFVQEASLPERVMDRDGRLHALRVLGLNVAAFQAPATTLIDAARSSQERTLRWHGTAELLDPNGIVVAEVAAEL